MGKSRYDEPIIPHRDRRKPYDLSDPVEALIADAVSKYEKVAYFPENTPDNWMHMICLRNVVPEICRSLRYANDKLKEAKKNPGAGPGG